jgi:hypothetical protein
MITKFTTNIFKTLLVICLFLLTSITYSQNDSIYKPKSKFWEKVNFGGGLGLNFGNGFSNLSISPTMYYNVNEKVMIGTGLNASYIKSRSDYKSWIYGGSIVALISPLEEIQLSTEFEQLRVNASYNTLSGYIDENFWNTALFLGAGYRTGGVTMGLRYNVLHNKENFIYSDPLMPFFRVIF